MILIGIFLQSQYQQWENKKKANLEYIQNIMNILNEIVSAYSIENSKFDKERYNAGVKKLGENSHIEGINEDTLKDTNLRYYNFPDSDKLYYLYMESPKNLAMLLYNNHTLQKTTFNRLSELQELLSTVSKYPCDTIIGPLINRDFKELSTKIYNQAKLTLGSME